MGGGRPEEARASKKPVDRPGGSNRGHNYVGGRREVGVGASMGKSAGAPCWGWWAREDVWLVCS